MIGGREIRWLGAALIVLGLVAVYRWFPTRPPESWQTVHRFRLDAEECLELREQRQQIDFEIPSEAVESGEAVTFGDLAENFNLELSLVCSANQSADCGGEVLPEGASVVLPLYRSPRSTPVEEP